MERFAQGFVISLVLQVAMIALFFFFDVTTLGFPMYILYATPLLIANVDVLRGLALFSAFCGVAVVYAILVGILVWIVDRILQRRLHKAPNADAD